MDFHSRPVLKRCQTSRARSNSFYVCVCVCYRGEVGVYHSLHWFQGQLGQWQGKEQKASQGTACDLIPSTASRTERIYTQKQTQTKYFYTHMLLKKCANTSHRPLNKKIKTFKGMHSFYAINPVKATYHF